MIFLTFYIFRCDQATARYTRSNIPLGVGFYCGVPFNLDDPEEDSCQHIPKKSVFILFCGVNLAVQASRKAAYCDFCENFHMGVALELFDNRNYHKVYFLINSGE